MSARRIALYWIAASLLACGCDRRPQVAAAPSTLPATVAVATTRDSSVPFEILIDGEPYDFPPAKLVVSNSDDKIFALLLTDDPPNAGSTDYRGNSVYLQMTMDIPDTNTLSGAQCEFQSDDTQRSDEIDGIYLDGQRKFLQPQNAVVKIVNGTSPATVSIDGTFLEFDDSSDDPTVGKSVKVQAQLIAGLKLKGAESSGK